MNNILTLEHVSKQFGTQKVLNDLNMTVPEHSVFGFIGRNGAGKTTTMNLILGFLQADSGTISICGESVAYGKTRTNRFLGYLPDVPEFYGYMTPIEYLTLCGEISGMSSSAIRHRIQELLPLVGLEEVQKKTCKKFSRGMKQRLGIAQALLNKPKLLLCDEPTSALDPAGRREILQILSQIKTETTIVFSSHILSDMETICDRVGILEHGKIQMEGELDVIRQSYRSDTLLLELADNAQISLLLSQLVKLPSLTVEQESDRTVRLTTNHMDADTQQILKILYTHQIRIQRLEIAEPSLEQLFLEVTA